MYMKEGMRRSVCLGLGIKFNHTHCPKKVHLRVSIITSEYIESVYRINYGLGFFEVKGC